MDWAPPGGEKETISCEALKNVGLLAEEALQLL